MEENSIIEEAKAYIKEIFSGNFDGHDMDHTLRVYYLAKDLASYYKEVDLLTISLAALLHDVDDHKLFKTENNQNARDFLEGKLSTEKIEEICRLINGVSFSKNRGKKPDSIEGKIVQDADRLDALGAIGIARTFAYGGRKGRPIEDSLGHFSEKLLLLKDEMNTKEARVMAGERHDFMVEFLKEMEREMEI